MATWQAIVSLVTFISVIFLLITEWLHFTIAAFLGALILIVLNVLTMPEALGYIGKSHGTLGLFFGVMVMVRAFNQLKSLSILPRRW